MSPFQRGSKSPGHGARVPVQNWASASRHSDKVMVPPGQCYCGSRAQLGHVGPCSWVTTEPHPQVSCGGGDSRRKATSGFSPGSRGVVAMRPREAEPLTPGCTAKQPPHHRRTTRGLSLPRALPSWGSPGPLIPELSGQARPTAQGPSSGLESPGEERSLGTSQPAGSGRV